MINFDALTIVPLMSIYGRPIYVTPRVSQPGQPSYWARGDYRIQNVDIATMEGVVSETELSLGIRIADFPVPPVPQDQVYVPAHLGQPAAGPFWIDDTDDDAQGHSKWALKTVKANSKNVPPGVVP